MRKHPEITEQTENNLIQALWKCWIQNPDNLSIVSICRTAGYNRTTFYNYFDSLKDIQNEAEERLLRDIMGTIEAIIRADSSDSLLSALKEIDQNYGVYLSVLTGPCGDMDFISKYKEALKPLAENQFRVSRSSPDADVLCEFSASVMISCLTYSALHPELEREHLFQEVHLFLNGGSEKLLEKKKQTTGSAGDSHRRTENA
ncbi:MAG: TetR/AcrR family transcriptional regulator [Bulleidia sp.]